MTDLDALTALLAAATTYCEQHMEMEHVNQIPPCAGARHEAEWWAEAFRLPALIEAARREAGLREALAELLAARDADMGEDNSAQMLEWASREYRACEAARNLLHDSAGAAAPVAGGP